MSETALARARSLAERTLRALRDPNELLARRRLLVASDGSGMFFSIDDAILAAADGDELVIKPGTYRVGVTIDRSIVITGNGTRDEIVMEGVQKGQPCFRVTPTGDLTLQHMTLEVTGTVGTDRHGRPIFEQAPYAVEVDAGSLTVDDIQVAGASLLCWNRSRVNVRNSLLEGPYHTAKGYNDVAALAVRDTSAVVVEGSTIGGRVAIDGFADSLLMRRSQVAGRCELSGNCTLEDNVLTDANVTLYADSHSFRGNVLVRSELQVDAGSLVLAENRCIDGSSIHVGPPVNPGDYVVEIRNNRFFGAGRIAIEAMTGFYDGFSITIADNVVSGYEVGICVDGTDGQAIIRANRISNNRAFGIWVANGASPVICENGLFGNGQFGIAVDAGGSHPVIYGNITSDNGRAGIVIVDGSDADAWGNHIREDPGRAIARMSPEVAASTGPQF